MRLHKKPVVTDTELLEKLIDLRNQYGRWPLQRELKADSVTRSYCTYIHRFGDYESAKFAARHHAGELTPAEMRAVKQRAPQVLDQLSQVAEQLEPTKRITASLLTKTPGAPTLRSLARYCCGLNNALRQLNLPAADPTREELIAIIQKLAEEKGKPPRKDEIGVEVCGYSVSVFLAEFVYWNDLLKEAGLETFMDQSKKRKPPKCVCSKSARANAGCSDG